MQQAFILHVTRSAGGIDKRQMFSLGSRQAVGLRKSEFVDYPVVRELAVRAVEMGLIFASVSHATVLMR